MTLNTHRRRDRRRCETARVWLNGAEVTSRCFYVDGRRGVVRLYRVDAAGQKFLTPDRRAVAIEERRGRVQFGHSHGG